VVVRILTIPFDSAKQLFLDDELNRFLLSKHVKEMRAAFFQMDSRPYWTVYIEYDPVLEETREPEEGLSEAQRLLFGLGSLFSIPSFRREKFPPGRSRRTVAGKGLLPPRESPFPRTRDTPAHTGARARLTRRGPWNPPEP